MKNPVLTLTHNCLELTKRCVASVLAQDIEVKLIVIDNASTDGTQEWLEQNWREMNFDYGQMESNRGVSAGWNIGINVAFEKGSEQILVLGNDVAIAPSTYRSLISCKLPFVTGVAVDNMEQALQETHPEVQSANPDFSMFCITKDAWSKLGPFNERMKHYCSDCDMHIRGHRLGISMMKASIPFYHERSSTLRLAAPEERIEIETQANKDRQVFQGIYGCLPGSKEYEEIFK